MVWLHICKQLQAFDGWHAKHGYYGLRCLTRDLFLVQQKHAGREDTGLQVTVATIKGSDSPELVEDATALTRRHFCFNFRSLVKGWDRAPRRRGRWRGAGVPSAAGVTRQTAATLKQAGGARSLGWVRISLLGRSSSLYCPTKPNSKVRKDRCVFHRGTSSYLPWRRSLADAAAAIFHC